MVMHTTSTHERTCTPQGVQAFIYRWGKLAEKVQTELQDQVVTELPIVKISEREKDTSGCLKISCLTSRLLLRRVNAKKM